ncbi:hypothetical protein BH09ACT3_BH09ACT3_16330 [soil metagenome]
MLAVGGTAIALLLVAAPAQAHNYVVATNPVAGSTLTELPEAFSITTNDALLDLSADNPGFALQIQDAQGSYYGDGCVRVEETTMFAEPVLGEAGTYTVTWQLVSGDGHTVSDRFDFSWQPTAEFEPSEGAATAPVCGVAAPTASAAPIPVPTETSEPKPSTEDETLSTLLWIGGAVLVVIVAIVVTVLLVGRRKPE